MYLILITIVTFTHRIIATCSSHCQKIILELIFGQGKGQGQGQGYFNQGQRKGINKGQLFQEQ